MMMVWCVGCKNDTKAVVGLYGSIFCDECGYRLDSVDLFEVL